MIVHAEFLLALFACDSVYIELRVCCLRNPPHPSTILTFYAIFTYTLYIFCLKHSMYVPLKVDDIADHSRWQSIFLHGS